MSRDCRRLGPTGIACVTAALCVGLALSAPPRGLAGDPSTGTRDRTLTLLSGERAAPTAPVVVPRGPAGAQVEVPILVYHYIRDDTNPNDVLGENLSVSPTLFAEQLQLLHAEGGHPITVQELVGAMTNHTHLPAHPVVLTFDDGYADFATAAAPVLATYGFVATDYVVSGFLGRPGFMTAAQVRAMDAAGLVIGSHTVNHVNLSTVPLPIAAAEIDGGKAALESLLGHPVLDFAYPYGGFSAAVVQLVEQAGFRDAVSTLPGEVQSVGDRFLLHRTHMGGTAQDIGFFASAAGIAQPDDVQMAETFLTALRALGVPLPPLMPLAPAVRRAAPTVAPARA